MDPIAVALSLMREALTLFDEIRAPVTVHYLQLAINEAEQINARAASTSASQDDGINGDPVS